MFPTPRTLLVTETFGPTFQGEGPSMGQPALFVRLSRCNLRCPACDEPRTWDTTRFDLREHTRRIDVSTLVTWALSHSTPLVVITGGEPLLQQHTLAPFIDALLKAGRRVEIETNGTITPDAVLVAQAGVRFNVSPKLPGFAADGDTSLVPEALDALAAADSICKFVIGAHAPDLAFAAAEQIVARHRFAQVWVMPEGTSSIQITRGLREMAQAALDREWCLSNRLHVQLWENASGR